MRREAARPAEMDKIEVMAVTLADEDVRAVEITWQTLSR
jgi:hypothetical protein